MNYFMKDLDTVAAGLLEGPGVTKPVSPTIKTNINGIVQDMLVSGYDPTKNKMQAITDMQRSNIPQDVIEHILGLADSRVADLKKLSASAVRRESYMDMVNPVVAPREGL